LTTLSTFGLKYLVMPLVPEGSAYNVMLKAPVGPSGDPQGRRYGRPRPTPASVDARRLAGHLPPAEIYPSLEKGVVTGRPGR
jgi:hypothetical protein